MQVVVQGERSGRSGTTVDPQLLKMALAPHSKLKAALFPAGPRGSSPSSDISVYHLLQVRFHQSAPLLTKVLNLQGAFSKVFQPVLTLLCSPVVSALNAHPDILCRNAGTSQHISHPACYSRLCAFSPYVAAKLKAYEVVYTEPVCFLVAPSSGPVQAVWLAGG